MCLQGTKKSSVSVAQGAAENLATAVSTDLSLKDSAKSDVITKPAVTGQEWAGRASDDKSGMICEKSTSDAADPPFDVISLLHDGQTLRYLLPCYGFC